MSSGNYQQNTSQQQSGQAGESSAAAQTNAAAAEAAQREFEEQLRRDKAALTQALTDEKTIRQLSDVGVVAKKKREQNKQQ